MFVIIHKFVIIHTNILKNLLPNMGYLRSIISMFFSLKISETCAKNSTACQVVVATAASCTANARHSPTDRPPKSADCRQILHIRLMQAMFCSSRKVSYSCGMHYVAKFAVSKMWDYFQLTICRPLPSLHSQKWPNWVFGSKICAIIFIF